MLFAILNQPYSLNVFWKRPHNTGWSCTFVVRYQVWSI